MINYEEALYQVYGPLPVTPPPLLHMDPPLTTSRVQAPVLYDGSRQRQITEVKLGNLCTSHIGNSLHVDTDFQLNVTHTPSSDRPV